jgi:glycosyltransferase involved in cell wall biosynthesis
MPTLALSMIMRDAAATLARCLESARPVVDEMVIADTGSTDETVQLARQFGARVFSIPWENDFAHARNRALEEIRSDGSWCWMPMKCWTPRLPASQLS